MLYLIVFSILLFVFSLLLLVMVSKSYVVKPIPHDKTPAVFNLPFEEIRFIANDKKLIYGWWMPQNANPADCKTIVLVHGWKRNLGRMLPYIEQLYAAGFNLLAFDARNHGSSQGGIIASMPRFTEDIISAIDHLQTIPGFQKATPLVLGLSMGGSAAIYAATRDTRISAVVTVGAFARPQDVMRREMEKKFIPYLPFGWLILEYAQHKIGQRFKTFAPVKNIAKTGVPILLIHGELDETTPIAQAHELYQASGGRAMLWALPQQGHSNCHHHPAFWERLVGYLNEMV